jgi:hypothetical protein
MMMIKITKTEWARKHTDDKKTENGQKFVIAYEFDNSGSVTRFVKTYWVAVQLK